MKNNIILVSDRIIIRDAIKTILTMNGYIVTLVPYIENIMDGLYTNSVNINDLKSIIISPSLLVNDYKYKIKLIKNSIKFRDIPILLYYYQLPKGTENPPETDEIISQKIISEEKTLYFVKYPE